MKKIKQVILLLSIVISFAPLTYAEEFQCKFVDLIEINIWADTDSKKVQVMLMDQLYLVEGNSVLENTIKDEALHLSIEEKGENQWLNFKSRKGVAFLNMDFRGVMANNLKGYCSFR